MSSYMMKKILQKKYLLFIAILAAVAIIFYFLFLNKPANIVPEVIFTEPENLNINSEAGSNNSNSVAINTNSSSRTNINTNTSTPKSPSSVLIQMPFLSQAPFANWDALHEDACEEASLIMVYHYYNKSTIGGAQQGEDEIQKLIEFEVTNNYGQSITLSELSNIANKYYNMSSGRILNADRETIIKQLDTGKPVIIPAAGKLLLNPNFKNGGPNYHMLVIKGYDKSGFITNDPGTKKGEGFRYSYDNLLESIHDWDPNNILNGEKKVLVFD